jgi:hypothetical protein
MGVAVLFNCVLIYLASAIVTTAVVFVASKWVGDELRPATHMASVSVAAGLVWPLLLLGMLELSAVLTDAKVRQHDAPGLTVVA